MMMVEKLCKEFIDRFKVEPLIFRSPGRVNIIGEHTDYNDGFVLPAAIDKQVIVAVSKREDDMIELFAGDFKEEYRCRVTEVKKSEVQWANYILGVVDQLQKGGSVVGGFNLLLDGDVPIGSGLSSSAAVECATIFALNEIFNLQQEKIRMVHMAQKAEHTFAGVMCGIMDQFASMMGKKEHVIKLDCRSLEYEYIPFKLEGYKILLLNTNVKHNLADSEYNVRRSQCEEGVSLVKAHYPEVRTLRDVTMKMLDECLVNHPLIYTRCKYVIDENARLLEACEALKQGNIKALGDLMVQTHWALSKEYEVSCKELDFLVNFVEDNPAVAGARMMGGGFGGCTINLVKEQALDELVADVSKAYEERMNLSLTHYVAVIDDGSSPVKLDNYK